MEGAEIFVEINCKEVETRSTRLQRLKILLYARMIVLSGFKGKTPSLLIAPSVPWNEEDGNAFDLVKISLQPLQVLWGLRPVDPHRIPPLDADTNGICWQIAYARYQNRRIESKSVETNTYHNPWSRAAG